MITCKHSENRNQTKANSLDEINSNHFTKYCQGNQCHTFHVSCHLDKCFSHILWFKVNSLFCCLPNSFLKLRLQRIHFTGAIPVLSAIKGEEEDKTRKKRKHPICFNNPKASVKWTLTILNLTLCKASKRHSTMSHFFYLNSELNCVFCSVYQINKMPGKQDQVNDRFILNTSKFHHHSEQ